MTNVTKWMSWEGGIDLTAVTSPDLQMLHVIVHPGRLVDTPVGDAPLECFSGNPIPMRHRWYLDLSLQMYKSALTSAPIFLPIHPLMLRRY